MQGHFTVGRIHGDVAIVVDDDGATFTVSLLDLPEGVDESMVLRADFDDEDEPDWSTAHIDEDEPIAGVA